MEMVPVGTARLSWAVRNSEEPNFILLHDHENTGSQFGIKQPESLPV